MSTLSVLRLSNQIFAHKIMRVKHVYYRQSVLPGQRWGRLRTNSTNVGGKRIGTQYGAAVPAAKEETTLRAGQNTL